MNASPPNPSRALRAYAAATRVVLWSLAALWIVLVLAWGALHGLIVPRVGELRPALEKQATRVLGVPLRIGAIEARSEGLVPSFELHDVVLLDAQGRPALRLPRIVAALTPRSIWNLGFDQLYIDRPELDIRRSADGHFYVAGLDFSRASDNDGRAADWFFSQTEFVIRGGTLRWTDEVRNAPPLALAQVDLVVRNRSRRHSMRLDATPPPQWGSRFSLTGDFRQPLLTAAPGRWQEWVGQLHADFTGGVDLSQLRRHADIGIEIDRGRGALRAWADVHKGRLTGGTADVVLLDVQARLGADLPPLVLESVSGRLGGKRQDNDGFEFQTQELQFRTQEGTSWPGGNVRVKWTAQRDKAPAQGELHADRLDLDALAQVASRLPLGSATHAALASYAPKGLVESLDAKWKGPLEALQSYEARGRAAGVEVAAQPAPPSTRAPGAGVPGLRGAALDFDLTQSGGRLKLAISQGALEFPGVFEDPVLPMDSLAADVQWKIDGAQVTTSVTNLKFSNADAQGVASGSWRTSDPAKSAGKARFPGVLDLQGSLARADGTRVWRYLPLGVPKAARDYVRESVQTGRATGVRFRVKGDLRDFPFADHRGGEFLITANVQDVSYAYVPRSATRAPGVWPALVQMSGDLLFQGNGMQVKGASGKVAGLPRLSFRADARIPSFERNEVAVTGLIRGPLADSLVVVNTSPLAGMTGQSLAKARGSGNADVALQLALPLSKIEDSQVLGTVTLAGNDVQITPDSPLLARARGAVTFTEKGFQLVGTQVRALGGDVRLEGGTRPVAGNAPPEVAIRAQGVVTAEALRQARELGFVSRVAREMSGSAPYAMTFTLRRGVPEIQVSSTLQGMALNLPPPLNKAAESALPLRYESALTREALAAPEGSPLRHQEQLVVELGRLAAVQYIRDISGAEPRVLRGTIGVGLAAGESLALPDDGVRANINLNAFNVDAWEDVLARVTAPEARAPAGPASAPAAAGASAAVAAAPPAAASAPSAGPGPAPASPLRSASGPGYLPTLMAVRARELNVEGRKLHNVVVGGSRDGLNWRANVDADEFNGYLEYRQPTGAGAGRLYARLARLKIATASASDVENLLDDQVASVPALDIVVEDFELRGKKMGRLEIDAINRGAGTVQREGGIREWRLNKLALTTPEAIFTATGNWAAVGATPVAAGGPRLPARVPGERRRMAMKFRMDISDSGALLARFGMKDVVRRGAGRLEGNIAWVGSPLALDYPTLTGAFHLDVERGQFLKADPGLAKLMGVLSLQSLPRRLALDFRDVFSEGFAFDFVRGDVTIEQGIASTNNLQMKGVNAAVLMDGKADIARETQDIKVVVVPEINAGTASLVYAVINPAIGIGSFLAQLFLRQPLIRAATQEFHIDGTWSDPRVTRVGRAPAEPSGTAENATR